MLLRRRCLLSLMARKSSRQVRWKIFRPTMFEPAGTTSHVKDLFRISTGIFIHPLLMYSALRGHQYRVLRGI